eukprot:601839-Rhodomonas_salina.2
MPAACACPAAAATQRGLRKSSGGGLTQALQRRSMRTASRWPLLTAMSKGEYESSASQISKSAFPSTSAFTAAVCPLSAAKSTAVHICTILEQQRDRLRNTLLGRFHQRRLLLLVPLIHLRARVQQHLDCRWVLDGLLQRRVSPLRVFRVDASPVLDQLRYQCRRPTEPIHRLHQQRFAQDLVLLIDIGPRSNQWSDDGKCPHPDSSRQRRVAILVACIHLRARLEAKPDSHWVIIDCKLAEGFAGGRGAVQKEQLKHPVPRRAVELLVHAQPHWLFAEAQHVRVRALLEQHAHTRLGPRHHTHAQRRLVLALVVLAAHVDVCARGNEHLGHRHTVLLRGTAQRSPDSFRRLRVHCCVGGEQCSHHLNLVEHYRVHQRRPPAFVGAVRVRSGVQQDLHLVYPLGLHHSLHQNAPSALGLALFDVVDPVSPQQRNRIRYSLLPINLLLLLSLLHLFLLLLLHNAIR